MVRAEPAADGVLGSPAAAGLLGLAPAELEARLGSPDFRREDAPAEFWRYGLERCALELVLYPAPDRSGIRVAYARLRPTGSGIPCETGASLR